MLDRTLLTPYISEIKAQLNDPGVMIAMDCQLPQHHTAYQHELMPTVLLIDEPDRMKKASEQFIQGMRDLNASYVSRQHQ